MFNELNDLARANQGINQYLFDDLKEAAIQIWETYDDTYGYASEKIDAINDIDNIEDIYLYFIQMFDDVNQQKLLDLVMLVESKRLIRDIIEGY